ncbi:MAG: redoxin domain-containing protein [Bacteroidetes bacterium]|nr:redoxin domain-containing protein [Bacteroidota bacterium]
MYSQQINFYSLQQEIQLDQNNYYKIIGDTLAYYGKLMRAKNSDTTALQNEYEKVFNTLNGSFQSKKESKIKLLLNSDYPDIIFFDENDKSHSMSEFQNQKIILNFNYSYCTPCYNQIDSILKNIPKNAKLIVLLHDSKQGASHLLEKYSEKILIGFISEENEDIYTLNSGAPFTIVLDENRKILYIHARFVKAKDRNLYDFILKL